MALPTYSVVISFGSSGDIDVSQYVQSVSISRGISRALEDYSAGSLSITFVNNARIFDPLNTSSPLYYSAGGYTVVQPGGRVKVSVGSIVRFTGFIQDWQFSYDNAGFDGKATLTALDRMYRVGNAVFTGGQAWDVQATSDRMRTVLNYNGFGAAEYSEIKAGQTLLGTDVWNAGDSVLSYLQQVARSEPGDFYSNASAVMVFKDRSFTNYNWSNVMRNNYVAYPATALKQENAPESSGVWILLGTQATATTSQFNASQPVFRGGTVGAVDPAEQFVGFEFQDVNVDRYSAGATAYVMSVYLRGISGNYSGTLQLLSTSGANLATQSVSATSTATTQWVRMSGTVSSTGVIGGVDFIAGAYGSTAYNIVGDGFMIEAGTALNDYFDGSYNPLTSSAGTVYEVAWAGTAYASISGLLTSTASSATAPGVLTFSDVNSQGTAGGTGIQFVDLQVAYGSENLYNKVQVIGVNATAVADDSTGQTRYGVKTYSQIDNLTTSSSKPSEIANALLAEWRLPEYRADQITIALESLTTSEQNLVLGVELRDVVRVCFKPSNTGSIIDKYYQVLGINANTDVERDNLTFTLGSLDNLPIRLDSTLLAILNTDTLG